MRQCVHIFRKDVRRYWPMILTLLGLRLVSLWSEGFIRGAGPGQLSETLQVLRILIPLASCILVAAVIQEESPCGDRRFWLTRPYDGRSLLAAKALFAFVVINLPSLLSDIYVSPSGIPLSAAAPHILWRQVTLTGWSVLGTVAVGAVCGSLPQLIFTAFLVVGGAATVLTILETNNVASSWGRLDWLRNILQLAIFAATALTVVLLQYARRNVLLARCVLATGVLLVVFVPVLLPFQSVFAVQSWLRGASSSRYDLKFTPDPDRVPRRSDLPVSHPEKFVRFQVPVLAEGAPENAALISDAAHVTIESPGGGHVWRSAWTNDTRVYGYGRKCWADVKAERRFVQANKDKLLTLRISAAMTVFSPEGENVTATRPGEVKLTDSAACVISGWFPQRTLLNCYFLRRDYRVLVHVEHAPNRVLPHDQIVGVRSYGPDASDVESLPFGASARPLPAGDADSVVVFTKQRPAIHTIREFTVSNLCLSEHFGDNLEAMK